MAKTTASSPFRVEFGATVRLAVPLAAANLLQMGVYAIDVMFVARLGAAPLAAASLAVSLFGLFVWGITGLTSAVAPLIAAELGRRGHAVRAVRRDLRMAFWLAGIVGLMAVAACGFGEAIMLATGQDPTIAAQAGGFLDILRWAAIPMVVANVLRIFVSALGRPLVATAITALALAVNALGNYALVFGNLGAPALGLNGSAIASNITAIGTVMAYMLVIGTDRRMRRYRILGRLWRPEWERLKQIVKIGIPIALTVVAEGGLFGSAAFLMGRIGAVELAAHAVALQVAAIFFQVPYGVGQAATIRVGYHYGAGNRAAIGQAGWAALAVGTGFMCLSATAMLLAPRLILSAYVDPAAVANAAMVGFAVQYLVIAAAFQLFDGIQTVAAGVLRGLQDTRVPMVIAVTGYWLIGFVTAAILGLGTPLEGIGVWLGLALSLVVVAVLLLLRWHRRERLALM
ncbi:MAG: MATE family efflux transporter [Novosphingobium sp.]|nr:MATE family efflux transporter [Novosphingobium sp.]